MKKTLFVVGLSLLAASFVGAACTGPFCYDDTGASVNGYSFTGAGVGIPDASSTTIAGIVPSKKGQLILCTSCTGNSSTAGGVVMCYSTATLAGSFVILGSSVPVCK